MQGRQALEAAHWEEARAAFEAALAEEETPDARDGLGLALWFLGGVRDAIAAREQAVEGYARAAAVTTLPGSRSGYRTSI